MTPLTFDAAAELDWADAAIAEPAPVGCDDPARHSVFIHSRAGQRFVAADVLDHE